MAFYKDRDSQKTLFSSFRGGNRIREREAGGVIEIQSITEKRMEKLTRNLLVITYIALAITALILKDGWPKNDLVVLSVFALCFSPFFIFLSFLSKLRLKSGMVAMKNTDLEISYKNSGMMFHHSYAVFCFTNALVFSSMTGEKIDGLSFYGVIASLLIAFWVVNFFWNISVILKIRAS